MKPLVAFIIGLIAFPILIVAAGLLRLLPSNSTSAPPAWENALGGSLLEAALEGRKKGLSNPIKPGDKSALAVGAKLYGDNCARCHGDANAPSKWGSTGFYPRAPQFYQRGTEDLTPEEAYGAIHDGIRYSGMGAWRDLMKPNDIWKVANFVATIKPLNLPAAPNQRPSRN